MVGGNAGVIRKDGFVFERALHQVYGMGEPGSAPHELLRRLGVLDELEFLPVDPMLVSVFPGLTFAFPVDVDRLERALGEAFPGSRRELTRLFRRITGVIEAIYLAKRFTRESALWRPRVGRLSLRHADPCPGGADSGDRAPRL